MPKTTESTGTEETPQEGAVEESQESVENEGGEGSEGQESEEEKLSYEDLEAALKLVRRESAGYRSQLRGMEEKLQAAKTPEEIEALVATAVAEREAVELDLMREAVAAKAGLPDELAELLKGSSREELEEHATKLSQFVPANETPRDPSGGLRPGSGGDAWANMDPHEIAKEVKTNPYLR